MHRHGGGISDVPSPDFADEIFTAVNDSRVLQEPDQQIELSRGKGQGLPVSNGPAGSDLDAQIPVDEDVGGRPGCRGGPTQQGTDAQVKLSQAERFRDVVVGSGEQSLDPLVLLRARRHHDEGKIAPHRAESSCHFEPACSGQHQVEQHQVDAGLGEPRYRCVSVGDRDHVVPGAGQVGRDSLAHRPIVFDQHQTHHGPTIGIRRVRGTRASCAVRSS